MKPPGDWLAHNDLEGNSVLKVPKRKEIGRVISPLLLILSENSFFFFGPKSSKLLKKYRENKAVVMENREKSLLLTLYNQYKSHDYIMSFILPANEVAF